MKTAGLCYGISLSLHPGSELRSDVYDMFMRDRAKTPSREVDFCASLGSDVSEGNIPFPQYVKKGGVGCNVLPRYRKVFERPTVLASNQPLRLVALTKECIVAQGRKASSPWFSTS